jgi:hypothetical protein
VTHAYAQAGTYTVQVTVTDIRGLASTATTVATIGTAAQGARNVIAQVDQLIAAGKVGKLAGVALKLELELAARLLDRGRPQAALSLLQGVVRQIDLLVRARRLSAADAAALNAALRLVIQSLSPQLAGIDAGGGR